MSISMPGMESSGGTWTFSGGGGGSGGLRVRMSISMPGTSSSATSASSSGGGGGAGRRRRMSISMPGMESSGGTWTFSGGGGGSGGLRVRMSISMPGMESSGGTWTFSGGGGGGGGLSRLGSISIPGTSSSEVICSSPGRRGLGSPLGPPARLGCAVLAPCSLSRRVRASGSSGTARRGGRPFAASASESRPVRAPNRGRACPVAPVRVVGVGLGSVREPASAAPGGGAPAGFVGTFSIVAQTRQRAASGSFEAPHAGHLILPFRAISLLSMPLSTLADCAVGFPDESPGEGVIHGGAFPRRLAPSLLSTHASVRDVWVRSFLRLSPPARRIPVPIDASSRGICTDSPAP
ncbi:MAG: hypothetical protein KatS3mg008_0655 [Acidimicrobiales bacterium]|nr:MAG: hypothetical protein KatS3mg008_0655 [Acidimicrobiales bacterium]